MSENKPSVFFRLTVVGVFAVLAEKMLVEQKVVGALDVGVNKLGKQRHFRHFLQYHRVFNRLLRVFAESERAVGLDEHRRRFQRIAALEALDNRKAGVLLVLAVYLFLGERADARNVAVEAVSVRGAVERNVPACANDVA